MFQSVTSSLSFEFFKLNSLQTLLPSASGDGPQNHKSSDNTSENRGP